MIEGKSSFILDNILIASHTLKNCRFPESRSPGTFFPAASAEEKVGMFHGKLLLQKDGVSAIAA